MLRNRFLNQLFFLLSENFFHLFFHSFNLLFQFLQTSKSRQTIQSSSFSFFQASVTKSKSHQNLVLSGTETKSTTTNAPFTFFKDFESSHSFTCFPYRKNLLDYSFLFVLVSLQRTRLPFHSHLLSSKFVLRFEKKKVGGKERKMQRQKVGAGKVVIYKLSQINNLINRAFEISGSTARARMDE